MIPVTIEAKILLDIALILLAAKILGEITERVGVSSLVGEVLAGLILGPILLVVQPSNFLDNLAAFGILFLMFLMGLHTNFEDIKKDAYKGGVLAVISTGLGFIGGFAIGMFVFNDIIIAVSIGVAILSSSTAIALRSLLDVGEVKTRVYDIALATELADEIIAILALSLLITYFTYGAVQIWTVIALFFAILGFFVAIMTAGAKIVSKFLNAFKIMKDENILISIPLVIIFFVAFLSEQVGIAGVTGAFLAGMAMSKSGVTEGVIEPKIKVIGYGFFIPLFFAYSAVISDIHAIFTSVYVVLMLVVVIIAASLVGIGYMSRFYKLDMKERLMLGASVVPRGEYAIVVSQVALAAAIITREVYSIIIAAVLITIIVTPLLLRAIHKRHFRP